MSADNNVFDALELLQNTKGIPVDYMIEKVEAALQTASKKETGCNNIRVDMNREKKKVRVFRGRTVVEEVKDPKNEISLEDAQAISRRYVLGTTVEEEIKTKTFGRLSAQAAKQVIVQAVREAEKGNIIKEYEKKREEIITARVVSIEESTGDIIIDTGTSNARLPLNEQIPGESYEVDDRIKVYIASVGSLEEKGPIVSVSRSHPNFIKRLFELEIPEIADGTIVIKSIAREAGSRSKVAVESRDPNVDAVGSCIGNQGARINAILDEIGNEKIDVIEYSDNVEKYIAGALSPATVKYVEFDGEKSATVTASSDQLSLAIGKEGQNVRLAAKLTGYKIDIKGPRNPFSILNVLSNQ